MSSVPDSRVIAKGLLDYCRANDWAGHDPYDALNSRIYLSLPFLHSRWPRVVLTQALKRSPINIRRLLLIPETQNAKALGLFVESLLKLSQVGMAERQEALKIAQIILKLRSPGTDRFAWGYSFPWQTRTIVVPRDAPNLVCTTFVANSLMSVYDATGDAQYLEAAVGAANYIANELFWTEGEIASFSYPRPGERSRIHNANLLAAAFLCRVARHAAGGKYVGVALKAARYSVSRQREDGSWMYGELTTQQWIDNFHTGYNLCALRDLGIYADTEEFHDSMRRGYRFYVDNFIRQDGAAKYFHDRAYPIDAHCVAQTIITLVELAAFDSRSQELARRAYRWAVENMWSDKGYFYYRVLSFLKIKTSYMRWSQAWMLLALATLAEHETNGPRKENARRTAQPSAISL